MKRSFAVVALLLCCLSQAPAQVESRRVRVSEGVMESFLIHRVRPEFPPDLGPDVQGPVLLRAVIDTSGNVENLQVISGNASLVPAAVSAARQWKYRPYLVNGIAVEVETTIGVGYLRLGESDKEGDTQSRSGDTNANPVPVSHETIQDHLVRKVAPIYPPLARQARIQGTVILRVIIDKEGNVSNLQLVSGHPMLAPAAIEAVKQWRYMPYELNGETVEVQTDVQVNFRLADNPAGRGVPEALEPEGNPPAGTLGGVIGGVLSSTPTKMQLSGERVSEAVMRPLRVRKVDPIYPGVAVQEHIQGTVVLDIRINSTGDVDEVMRTGGPPTLVPPAMEAVQQWKYTPYGKDGKAIPVVSTVRLSFSLEENENGVVNEPEPSEDANPPRIAVPQRVRVSSGVSSGLLVRKVAPLYPADARDARVQGTVLLRANIDKQGNVSSLEVISGHPMLAPAAIEAVRQWKYRPYLLNGEAVEVDTQIQVNFVLAR